MSSRVTIVRMKPSEALFKFADRIWRVVRPLGRRIVGIWPLTALGMALAAVALIALIVYGFEKLDLVLLVLGFSSALGSPLGTANMGAAP